MPNIEQIVARLNAVTDKLSTQVRTLSVGILVFAGGLLIGSTPINKALPEYIQLRVLCIACLAFLALLADLLQYVAGYVVAQMALQELEKRLEGARGRDPGTDCSKFEVQYDDKHWVFRLQEVFSGQNPRCSL